MNNRTALVALLVILFGSTLIPQTVTVVAFGWILTLLIGAFSALAVIEGIRGGTK